MTGFIELIILKLLLVFKFNFYNFLKYLIFIQNVDIYAIYNI